MMDRVSIFVNMGLFLARHPPSASMTSANGAESRKSGTAKTRMAA